ncbi:putative ferric reductase [Humibacillus xanthopallidus]|uniref:Putative ferric reductase n=1 Tax=Humibacillus xanthopallidus TaxID=412689 RepID=A0A543I1U4_9MICO|nr:putative ferric reductase [Humibacillus xanthopallidus]
MTTIGVVSNTMSSPRVARSQPADRVRVALRRGREHRRWRARVADLLEATALLTLVLVVVQFFLGGGSHALMDGTAGDRLVGVGRIVGLVAMNLLLLQLLLAARVPWVDRAYGMDRALKAHRVLGRITVPLVIVHVGAIVLGYDVRDGSGGVGGAVSQFLTLVTGGDDLLMATVATVLLVVIAVTSVSIARKRLSYEWWHAVHLTAYAAVILAVPHELSIGSDFTASSWATAYWWTLFIVVAASVLWWRFLLPVLRSLRHDLRVAKVVHESDDVWSVTVQGRALSRLPVKAGQFLNWRFVSPGLFLAAHPWSVSRRPDGHTLRITVRGLGDHSAALAHLRRGTRVLVEGPYGAFTTESRVRRRVLLIAAGIGVTPVRAILEELVVERHAAAGDVTVLYRANDASQMPLVDEIARLTHAGGHALLPLIGPPANGSWLPPLGDGSQDSVRRRELVRSDAERLRELVPDVARHEVYLCGPGPWMDLVRKGLHQAGVPEKHIHDERFSW